MKKLHYLPVLFVAVFLLLCACARETAPEPQSSTPVLGSVPSEVPSSAPVSMPTTVPTTAPTTAPPAPTTKPVTVPTSPTTPATTPTQPTVPIPPPIRGSADWIVEDREVIPFEERFEHNISFPASYEPTYGYPYCQWLGIPKDGVSTKYSLNTTGDNTYPLVIYENGQRICEISCHRYLYRNKLLCADGHWAYLLNESETEFFRVDLLTGDCVTLLFRPTNLRIWEIIPCGKDTVLVTAVDQCQNLKIFYRDLHSEAEKVLYEGALPGTYLEDFYVYAPTGTREVVRWKAMNPAFCDKIQEELRNPDSIFRYISPHDEAENFSRFWDNPADYPASISKARALCIRIQNYYRIPAQVMYSVDPLTGELTTDYGLIGRNVWPGTDHSDYFNYENTREMPLQVLESEPVEIPTLTTLTPEQAEAAKADEHNLRYLSVSLINDTGYAYPYLIEGNRYIRLSDIPCKEILSTMDYIYCITLDNSVLQISPEGVCNTVYTSDDTMYSLCHYAGSIYFVDGDTVVRIDTIAGAYTALLQSDGTLTVDDFGFDPGEINILVVQGLYNQQYFFNPDTRELEKTKFI